jgi:hypothetical protein
MTKTLNVCERAALTLINLFVVAGLPLIAIGVVAGAI